MINYVCPIDKSVLFVPLKPAPEFPVLHCPTCGRDYAYKDDIPILLPPQLREQIDFDDYKYLDDPIHPAWNAGLVTTRSFVDSQLHYEKLLNMETFSGNRYRWFRDKAQGDYVIDIGCNGGGVTNLLEGDRATYGLDFLLRHLLHAKRTCKPSIKWVNAAAEYLPFPDNSFNTTCLGEMMEHVPNPQLAALEAVRVLKPGAKLLIVNQDKSKEFRPGTVRHTMNPCNGDELKIFLDTLPIEYSIEWKEGTPPGSDPDGWFVEGFKND